MYQAGKPETSISRWSTMVRRTIAESRGTLVGRNIQWFYQSAITWASWLFITTTSLLLIVEESKLCELPTMSWIIGGRGLVKKTIRSCIRCQRMNAKPLEQFMGLLPRARLEAYHPPFTFTGLLIFILLKLINRFSIRRVSAYALQENQTSYRPIKSPRFSTYVIKNAEVFLSM